MITISLVVVHVIADNYQQSDFDQKLIEASPSDGPVWQTHSGLAIDFLGIKLRLSSQAK